MTEFDPEKFEDKYVHYLQELETAYKRAFETMNDAYDSELVHAIDQQVLNESEPVYEGEGAFRVELPEDPIQRIEGALVDDEKAETTLERYVDEIDRQLRREFDFEE